MQAARVLTWHEEVAGSALLTARAARLQELSLLQDRVPAFEPARAIAIVEGELGGPLGTHFASFDRSPIAAASLGQVHAAPLSTLLFLSRPRAWCDACFCSGREGLQVPSVHSMSAHMLVSVAYPPPYSLPDGGVRHIAAACAFPHRCTAQPCTAARQSR